MAHEFKKIADLELVNEVPAGANLVVEADGVTKRLPATAINNGYSKEEVYTKEEVYSKEEADGKYLTEAPEQVQANFEQNDPTQPDYVKGRTHWEETSETTAEYTLQATGESSGFGDDLEVAKAIMANPEKVVVRMGGVDLKIERNYEVEGNRCKYYFTDLNGDRLPGGTYSDSNLSISIDNGEPTGYMNFDGPSFGGNVIVSVPILQTTVHKLDKKFLPDGVGGGGGNLVVYVHENEEGDLTISASGEDIKAAVENGRNVIAILTSDIDPNTDGEIYHLNRVYMSPSGGSAIAEFSMSWISNQATGIKGFCIWGDSVSGGIDDVRLSSNAAPM